MTSTDATKKLIHDLNVDILGRLSKGVVKDSVFNEKRTDDTKALRKKDVIAGIVNEIEKIGVKRMSDSLHVADAQAICETLEVDFKDSSKSNKNVLSKRLRARVVKDGLEEVLGLLEADQQTACLEALEVKDKSGTAKSIAVRLAGEVRRVGTEIVLSKMDMAFLKDLAETQGLDVYDLNSQTAIISSILTGKVPAKRPRVEAKKEPISKKKPKLQAGITVTDMMQHYNLTELQDFARDNGVVISGKKKDLMKRIAAFFEEEAEPVAKKGKKETKKETKESKKETKETKEPKSPKKEKKKGKKEDKAEEVEAEEEEVVEEAEEPKKTKKGKKEEEKAEESEVVEEAEAEEAPKGSKSPKSPKSPKKAKAKKGGKKEDKEVGER